MEYFVREIEPLSDGKCRGTLQAGRKQFSFVSDCLPVSASPTVIYTSSRQLIDNFDPQWREPDASKPTLRADWRKVLSARLSSETVDALRFLLRDVPEAAAAPDASTLLLVAVNTKRFGWLPVGCNCPTNLLDNIHVMQCERWEDTWKLYLRFGRPATEFSITRSAKELAKLAKLVDDDLVTFSTFRESTAMAADPERADAWARLVTAFKRRPVAHIELTMSFPEKVVRFFLDRNLLLPMTFGGKPFVRPHYWCSPWVWDDAYITGVRHTDAPESDGCARHSAEEVCRACYSKRPPMACVLVANGHCALHDPFLWAFRNRFTSPPPLLPANTVRLGRNILHGELRRPGTFPYQVFASLEDVAFDVTPSYDLKPNVWAVVDGTVLFVESWQPMVYRVPFSYHTERFTKPSVPASVTVLPGCPSEVLAAFVPADSFEAVHLICLKSEDEWSAEAEARVIRILKKDGSIILDF